MIARRYLLAFAALLILPGLAHADTVADDEVLVQRGIELRTDGKNREALAAFEEALALRAAPRTRAQIALARQALGEWIDAERGLEEALHDEADPWIARYRPALEGALATVRAHLAWLRVDVDVEGAEVRINDAPARAGEALRVESGSTTIDVRAPRYADAHRVIAIAAGANTVETVRLEAQAPIAVPVPIAPVALEAPSSGRRTAAIATLSGAGALAIVGIVAWRIGDHEASIWNDDTRCLLGTRTRGEQCGDHETAIRTALGVEIGAFSAAAIAASVGVWLLATPPAKHTARATCVPALGLGVACTGSF